MRLDKRTAALGLAAAGAVAAAVVVTVTNHRGSGESKQRRAVSAYITQVNAVENGMHRPLTRVMLAYRDFTSKQPTSGDPAPELAAAARTLEKLNRRLGAIPAPPEAKTLRARLVDLVDRQAAITREVGLIAVFRPRFAAILQRADAASKQLGLALAAVQVPKAHSLKGTKKAILAAQARYAAEARAAAAAQADAVDAYDEELAAVISSLRSLHAPASMNPMYEAQLHAFQHVRTAGARLADELRKARRTNVPALGRKFTLAAREAQSVAAQRAEIAAIRAYNKRAKAISLAQTKVQLELARLQQTLP